jgi:thiamine biosynthesis protein ThiS
MNIILNNNPETIETDRITLQELIDHKNYTFKLLITKINGQLVKREDRKTIQIKYGDNIAVIHLISGG